MTKEPESSFVSVDRLNESADDFAELFAQVKTHLWFRKVMKEACTNNTKVQKSAKQQYNAMQRQNLLDIFDQDQKHQTRKIYTIQLYTRWRND